MHFWMLALRNLGRNTKRNLATGSAIAFGFAGILLLCAYAYRAKNYIGVYTIYGIHTGHLAVYARGGFERFGFEPGRFSLSPAQQEKVLSVLKNEPSVEIFERQIRGQGLIGNGCISLPFQAQGYEPEVDRALRSHPEVKNWMPHFNYLLAGQGMWRYPASVNPILLSKGLALALGKSRLYDEIGSAPPSAPDCSNPREQGSRDSNVQLLAGAWAGTLSAADGEVVGLYTTGFQETENSGILAPVSFLQKLFDTDRIAELAAAEVLE